MNTALEQPKLQTNLDTDFLKVIACITMLIDHIGGAFFPEVQAFRIIGRTAFPLFCYCMTVGLLYTRDIKKYLLRLAVFAAVSQPFYLLATHPFDWREEFFNWNIFFTLFISLPSGRSRSGNGCCSRRRSLSSAGGILTTAQTALS